MNQPDGALDEVEVNFDGLVGPTHNYAGLSYGNVASMSHGGQVASPRLAALQGLEKMKLLADLGLPQGVLPPQARPDVGALRAWGFDSGDDATVLVRAAREAPTLLALACSASSMWTANAATVAPSADTDDDRVHFTPANLQTTAHRALESGATASILRAVFSSQRHFVHHPALPGGQAFSDEGGANHTRLLSASTGNALHMFAYGRVALDRSASSSEKFPARQTLEASRAVARLHRLQPDAALFVQQHPAAIDAGVFHNDVISVGSGSVLLLHEDAFLDQLGVLRQIRARISDFRPIVVRRKEVSLQDAVASYLFNSQLLAIPGRAQLVLLAPIECQTNSTVQDQLTRLVAEPGTPIEEVMYVDLRQSMHNGGGPACLRLRVPLNRIERSAVNASCWLTAALYTRLVAWVRQHYRERVAPQDLADPQLLGESHAALDELTQILQLGSIYPFQRASQTA